MSDRRLRILYLIGSLRRGGAEKNVVEVLSRLDRRRFDPQVAVFVDGGELMPRVRELALPVHVLDVRPPLLAGRNLLRVARFRRLLVRERIDLVHAYLVAANIFAAAARRIGRVPFVAGLRSEDSLKFGNLMRAHLWSLRQADGLVAVSRAVRRAYAARGVPADRIRVIENGIDPMPPPEPRERSRAWLGVDPERVVVTAVGSLGPEKDHRSMLAAAETVCREHPGALFVFAGDGPLRGELEAEAERLGLGSRTRFLGHVTEVRRLLNASDVFCLPSVVEGMSNALMEAMAHGLPSVVTRVGANDEMIPDGQAGLTVSPRDAEGMARALGALVADASRRREFGQAARERVQRHYSADRMMQMLEAYYRTLVPDPADRAVQPDARARGGA